jgi:hypothetical protein
LGVSESRSWLAQAALRQSAWINRSRFIYLNYDPKIQWWRATIGNKE